MKASQMHSQNRRQVIFDACRDGDEQRVLGYINDGGSLTERDGLQMTMLHHLAYSGNSALVSALLKAGETCAIDVDATDSEGWTALHYAVERGDTATSTVLLNAGANVNRYDTCKRTPLQLAVQRGDEAMVSLLLRRGACKAAKNVTGRTPLDYAIEGKYNTLVEMLKTDAPQ